MRLTLALLVCSPFLSAQWTKSQVNNPAVTWELSSLTTHTNPQPNRTVWLRAWKWPNVQGRAAVLVVGVRQLDLPLPNRLRLFVDPLLVLGMRPQSGYPNWEIQFREIPASAAVGLKIHFQAIGAQAFLGLQQCSNVLTLQITKS